MKCKKIFVYIVFSLVDYQDTMHECLKFKTLRSAVFCHNTQEMNRIILKMFQKYPPLLTKTFTKTIFQLSNKVRTNCEDT